MDIKGIKFISAGSQLLFCLYDVLGGCRNKHELRVTYFLYPGWLSRRRVNAGRDLCGISAT